MRRLLHRLVDALAESGRLRPENWHLGRSPGEAVAEALRRPDAPVSEGYVFPVASSGEPAFEVARYGAAHRLTPDGWETVREAETEAEAEARLAASRRARRPDHHEGAAS